MDLKPIQVSSYPFIFEASGDSEDDRDKPLNSIGCECDMSHKDVVVDDDDNDDAESCSYDSWVTSCANGCVDDGEHGDSGGSRNDEDYCTDDEDKWSFRKAGVTDFVMGSVSQDQEEKEEVVQATTVLREAMDAMGDKEFWEACLATGYA
ncbi:hypothetical protein MRB53_010775 [Persea americana]|uniref:Uncharacterized protein n=1 Tax=Persea americana TaxID=3435 RepID=A0ACC2LTI0_PERAE|nr:hypothetical protein MRB53_010775 [Persea americana]